MNYETQLLGDSAIIMDGDDRRRSRKKLIIGAGVVVALIAVAAAISMRGGDPAATPAPGAVAPVVTVTSPGQSTVARTVRATGSLAARVDMPVGVVGEGGMVSRVLVQPGDWVKAGQTLATIERSVQSEQVRSLAKELGVPFDLLVTRQLIAVTVPLPSEYKERLAGPEGPALIAKMVRALDD